MTAKYDTIGVDYAALRKPDPRIARSIVEALGPARTILNVGAGTGSYEPPDRSVIAVEPSTAMIRARRSAAAPAVQAVAEALPFADKSFDAAMAILTIHHWSDLGRGLRELRRVTSGRIVILTFDPSARPWLTDYLPALAALDERQFPPMSRYADWLSSVRIEPVPIPHDCSDGFLYAYWRRPSAYLNARVRSGSSSFWEIGAEAGLGRLHRELENGMWAQRYADVLACDAYDAGYRLVVSP